MRAIIISLLSVAGLSGCASTCTHACILGWGPGSASFNAVALSQDRQDPCQGGPGASAERKAQLGRPADYQLPWGCGAGGVKHRLYDRQGRLIGIIR
jgi:hypothetical protein